MIYELIKIDTLADLPYIIRREDETGEVWLIPFDDANSDYQNYLVDTDGGLPFPEGEK